MEDLIQLFWFFLCVAVGGIVGYVQGIYTGIAYTKEKYVDNYPLVVVERARFGSIYKYHDKATGEHLFSGSERQAAEHLKELFEKSGKTVIVVEFPE